MDERMREFMPKGRSWFVNGLNQVGLKRKMVSSFSLPGPTNTLCGISFNCLRRRASSSDLPLLCYCPHAALSHFLLGYEIWQVLCWGGANRFSTQVGLIVCRLACEKRGHDLLPFYFSFNSFSAPPLSPLLILTGLRVGPWTEGPGRRRAKGSMCHVFLCFNVALGSPIMGSIQK